MAHKNIRDALGDLVPFVQFKNRESTCGEVLLSVKLQAKVCKSITPLWVFFTFFKLTWASHMFVSQTWRPSLILTISGIWNIFSEKETKWKKIKKGASGCFQQLLEQLFRTASTFWICFNRNSTIETDLLTRFEDLDLNFVEEIFYRSPNLTHIKDNLYVHSRNVTTFGYKNLIGIV